jgi:hypothetical protein
MKKWMITYQTQPSPTSWKVTATIVEAKSIGEWYISALESGVRPIILNHNQVSDDEFDAITKALKT